ncbi:MAG TPA: REC domain-containing diguanylate cyclase [Richelia sp.]|nr:REC domain-containing diguanylate cyclase [Richelia sp.]
MDLFRIIVIEDKNIAYVEIEQKLQKIGYSISEINGLASDIIKRISEANPNVVLLGSYSSECNKYVEIAGLIQEKLNIPVLYLGKDSIEPRLCNQNTCNWYYGNCILKKYDKKKLYTTIKVALYQQQIEIRIQQEHHKWLTAINSMGSAVIIIDIHSKIELMNPMAEALTGWHESEALAVSIERVLEIIDSHTGRKIDYLFQQVIVTGEVVTLPDTCILITKSGKQIPIGDSIAPICDDHGNINGAIIIFQDISERKKIESQLLRHAFYDSLTSLPNRVLFQDVLQQVFERSKQQKDYQFAVLFIDLDGFKGINDKFGHRIGDEFLAVAAQRLESCLRNEDTIARLGGDEFAILLEDIINITSATQVAQRIHKTLESPLNINGHEIFTTASIGISISNHEYEEAGLLLRDADIAMYHAKDKGKANYVIFHERLIS